MRAITAQNSLTDPSPLGIRSDIDQKGVLRVVLEQSVGIDWGDVLGSVGKGGQEGKDGQEQEEPD